RCSDSCSHASAWMWGQVLTMPAGTCTGRSSSGMSGMLSSSEWLHLQVDWVFAVQVLLDGPGRGPHQHPTVVGPAGDLPDRQDMLGWGAADRAAGTPDGRRATGVHAGCLVAYHRDRGAAAPPDQVRQPDCGR